MNRNNCKIIYILLYSFIQQRYIFYTLESIVTDCPYLIYSHIFSNTVLIFLNFSIHCLLNLSHLFNSDIQQCREQILD